MLSDGNFEIPVVPSEEAVLIFDFRTRPHDLVFCFDNLQFSFRIVRRKAIVVVVERLSSEKLISKKQFFYLLLLLYAVNVN